MLVSHSVSRSYITNLAYMMNLGGNCQLSINLSLFCFARPLIEKANYERFVVEEGMTSCCPHLEVMTFPLVGLGSEMQL